MTYTLSYACLVVAMELVHYNVEWCFVALVAGAILGMTTASKDKPSIHGVVVSCIAIFTVCTNLEFNTYTVTAVALCIGAVIGQLNYIKPVITLPVKKEVPKKNES